MFVHRWAGRVLPSTLRGVGFGSFVGLVPPGVPFLVQSKSFSFFPWGLLLLQSNIAWITSFKSQNAKLFMGGEQGTDGCCSGQSLGFVTDCVSCRTENHSTIVHPTRSSNPKNVHVVSPNSKRHKNFPFPCAPECYILISPDMVLVFVPTAVPGDGASCSRSAGDGLGFRARGCGGGARRLRPLGRVS